MAGVKGIGGIFFRARDPDALGKWYADHLGLTIGGPWLQAEGIAVFSLFQADTDYWPADKQWMLNLRVEGLDELIASLQTSEIAVETRADWDDPTIGRFARIEDPEGNAVELWEPPT